MSEENGGYHAFIYLSLGEGRALHYLTKKYKIKYENKEQRGKTKQLVGFWTKLEQKFQRFCDAITDRANNVHEPPLPEGTGRKPRPVSPPDPNKGA